MCIEREKDHFKSREGNCLKECALALIIIFEDASDDYSMGGILGETQRRPEEESVLLKFNVKICKTYANIISTFTHEMSHALETGRDNHGQQFYANYMALRAIFKAKFPNLDYLGNLGYLKASYLACTMDLFRD